MWHQHSAFTGPYKQRQGLHSETDILCFLADGCPGSKIRQLPFSQHGPSRLVHAHLLAFFSDHAFVPWLHPAPDVLYLLDSGLDFLLYF